MDFEALFAVLEMCVGWELPEVHLPWFLDPWQAFESAGEVLEFWSPRC